MASRHFQERCLFPRCVTDSRVQKSRGTESIRYLDEKRRSNIAILSVPQPCLFYFRCSETWTLLLLSVIRGSLSKAIKGLQIPSGMTTSCNGKLRRIDAIQSQLGPTPSQFSPRKHEVVGVVRSGADYTVKYRSQLFCIESIYAPNERILISRYDLVTIKCKLQHR